jgi:hypothetical protein
MNTDTTQSSGWLQRLVSRLSLTWIALRCGRSIGRAAAHYEEISRESWKKAMDEELEESWAREEARLACLAAVRSWPGVPEGAVALIELELADENPGAKLIEELRKLRRSATTCPHCGNYYPGHATGGHDICDCQAANEALSGTGGDDQRKGRQ